MASSSHSFPVGAAVLAASLSLSFMGCGSDNSPVSVNTDAGQPDAGANCPAGQHDGGDGSCVPQGVCAQGYHDGGNGGECVPEGECSEGFHDGGGGYCSEIGTCWGSYHDGGDGACVPLTTCSPGFHASGLLTCVPLGECAEGFHDDGKGDCIAQGSCAEGFHNGGDGSCQAVGTCATGFHDDGRGACASPDVCAEGFHDGGNGVCVAQNACSEGFHDGGEGDCLEEGTCAQGFHDSGEGKCEDGSVGCLEGYQDGGDGNCTLVGTCSGGYHDGGLGACLPLATCNGAFTLDEVTGDCEFIYDAVQIPAGMKTGKSRHGDGTVEAYDDGNMTSFRIGRTEVTVDQYDACIRAGACVRGRGYTGYDQFADSGVSVEYYLSLGLECVHGLPGKGSHPMNCIAQEVAEDYCKWLGGRLPTQDEWEYAATHDGREHRSTLYPWGEDAPVHCASASYYDNQRDGRYCDGRTEVAASVGPSPVGTYSPDGDSPLGLKDMAGNVGEWTHETTGSGTDREAMVKGGSYTSLNRHGATGDDMRITADYGMWTDVTNNQDAATGFRCVLPFCSQPGMVDDGMGRCVSATQGDPLPCAQGYHDGGNGGCLPEGQCVIDHRNDGTGKCVSEEAPCAQGYRDNGRGVCISGSQNCGEDYHEGGDGSCVRVGTCAQGYGMDHNGDCIRNYVHAVIPIPAGSYRLPAATYSNSKGTTVTVDAFSMDNAPVTMRRYLECVGAGACAYDTNAILKSTDDRFCNYKRGNDYVDYPANCVTFEAAQAFCAWANGRLPTEEEWMYAAAHDGTSWTGTIYPWGNRPTPYQAACSFANLGSDLHGVDDLRYCDGRRTVDDIYGTTQVGTYSPVGDSPLGIMDLIGNVTEFVADGNGLRTKGGSYGLTSIASLEIGYVGQIKYTPGVTGQSPSIGFRCVYAPGACPAGTHADGAGGCAAQGCAQGYKDDGSGKNCVALTSPCAAGYHDNGDGVCVTSGCASGYYYDAPHSYCARNVVHKAIYFPAGTFKLQVDTASYAKGDTASVGAFEMDNTPVTVEMFKKCVDAGRCDPVDYETYVANDNYRKACNMGRGDAWAKHPMNCVAWQGARDYCAWQGRRLPTEEEWEYAATHDGTRNRGTIYVWGDTPPVHCVTADYFSYANKTFCDGPNEIPSSTDGVGTAPVGYYSRLGDSPAGLMDMAGSVSNWTSSPKSASLTSLMVFRGGAWTYNDSSGTKVTTRDAGGQYVNTYSDAVGFRCVKSR